MEEGKVINIKVNIADRNFGLTIKEDEEEIVRKAATSINERIVELKKKYQAQDPRDYLAMALLLNTVDGLKNQFKTEAYQESVKMLSDLDNKLVNFFKES